MRKRQPENEAERLVRTYADLILRLSYTYLKSTHDAEDICQNVLIKLLQDGRASVALEAAAGAAAPETPDSDVLDAVMALPQAYREAVYLHYYEGYTAREIAQMTDRTEDAVAAHLSRGRAKLRAALEGADDDR